MCQGFYSFLPHKTNITIESAKMWSTFLPLEWEKIQKPASSKWAQERKSERESWPMGGGTKVKESILWLFISKLLRKIIIDLTQLVWNWFFLERQKHSIWRKFALLSVHKTCIPFYSFTVIKYRKMIRFFSFHFSIFNLHAEKKVPHNRII